MPPITSEEIDTFCERLYQERGNFILATRDAVRRSTNVKAGGDARELAYCFAAIGKYLEDKGFPILDLLKILNDSQGEKQPCNTKL